jgi:serine/threonine protein kinase
VNNPLHAGTTFGPYVIDSMLGSGGMGVVYRARDPRLDREVAIKMIPPEHCDSVERRRRFETEARSAARLAHPNVVAIYDVGEQNGTPYIVAELVEGGTLADRIRRGPPPNMRRCRWRSRLPMLWPMHINAASCIAI